MAISQKFGGNWTEKKLNIFTSYLNAYLIALQKMKFKKIYIDAFAGTGEIETSNGTQRLVGSAKRALASEKKFDHYYFIEADSQKAKKLQEMINSEFPKMRPMVTVFCGDANEKLEDIISSIYILPLISQTKPINDLVRALIDPFFEFFDPRTDFLLCMNEYIVDDRILQPFP